ncbi:MAG TPA: alanine racemase, partial [Gemmatimonadaceae bacterium]
MSLTISDLETPVPVVDLDRLARNLDRAAEYATAHALSLRPHIKTHKSPRIASEQLKRGAVGVTCATPFEAEVMSSVCDDILVAYPPVGARASRLASLPETIRLTVALDSLRSIDEMASAARDADRPVGVYIELDLGMHRVGTPRMDEAVALAQAVRER